MAREPRSQEARGRGIPKSNSRNAIPRGTVASCIRNLQALSTIESSAQRVVPVSKARRYEASPPNSTLNSINLSFVPISRAEPQSEPVGVVMPHTFFGYKTPRINHEQVHASCMADLQTTRAAAKASLSAKRAVSAGFPSAYRPILSTRIVSCPTPHISTTSEGKKWLHIDFQQMLDPMVSVSSTATTSTLRRQSVRDLFLDHGVERPSGFASPTGLTEQSLEVGEHSCVSCHICFHVNEHVRTGCDLCGHRFCSTCSATIQLDGANNSKMRQAKTKSVEQKMTSPPLYDVKAELRRHAFRQLAAAFRLPIAERGALERRALDCRAVQQRKNQVMPETLSATDRDLTKDYFSISSTSISASSGCESPTCKATHRGHSPFRHATSCTQKSDATEMGITMQSAHVHESANSITPTTDDNPYFSIPYSRTSHAKVHVANSSSIRHEARRAAQVIKPPSGYVICRGYPRTGHERCGSPVEEGIVGNCQHCIDDCDCQACQSVPHAVRCCTSKEHRTVIHLHQTSGIRSMRTTTISSSEETQGAERLFPALMETGGGVDRHRSRLPIVSHSTERGLSLQAPQNGMVTVGKVLKLKKDPAKKPTAQESTFSFADLRAIQQQVSKRQSISPQRARKRQSIVGQPAAVSSLNGRIFGASKTMEDPSVVSHCDATKMIKRRESQ